MTSTGDVISEKRSEAIAGMPDRRCCEMQQHSKFRKKSVLAHTRPFFGDNRLEAIRRKKKRVNFMKTKRAR